MNRFPRLLPLLPLLVAAAAPAHAATLTVDNGVRKSCVSAAMNCSRKADWISANAVTLSRMALSIEVAIASRCSCVSVTRH